MINLGDDAFAKSFNDPELNYLVINKFGYDKYRMYAVENGDKYILIEIKYGDSKLSVDSCIYGNVCSVKNLKKKQIKNYKYDIYLLYEINNWSPLNKTDIIMKKIQNHLM